MKHRISLLLCLFVSAVISGCSSGPMSWVPASERVALLTEASHAPTQGTPSHLPISQRLTQLKQQYAKALTNSSPSADLAIFFQPQQNQLDPLQRQRLIALIKTHKANILTQANIIGGPRGSRHPLTAAYRTEQRMQLIAQLFQQNRIATHLYYDPSLPVDSINVTLVDNKQV